MNETPMLEPLRLVAFDCEDLEVLSANLQDALIRVDDMAFLPGPKRFALLGTRFDWAKAETGSWERCRTGLHFERVLKVSCSGFAQRDKALILNLLSICFRETRAPAGEVELIFSGGCALRLQVECLEARLRDLDVRWATKVLPGHPCEDWPDDAVT
jgi:hypothetical protein